MHISTVTLRANNAPQLAAFYEQRIGLQRLSPPEAHEVIDLGVGDAVLLRLLHTPENRRYRSAAGLYHIALRVPSRPHLGRVLRHLAEQQTPLQGLSDHGVSEAIYLADPEGNGIEIYRDRPQEAWYEDGAFRMANAPVDTHSLLADGAGLTWAGLPLGTDMGHIHLHVSDLDSTQAFYVGRLGMDVMMDLDSARFLSYEGYHHHLGTNIWAGRNIQPPDALGLEEYIIAYDDAALFGRVTAALGAQAQAQADGSFIASDPSGLRVRLGLASL